MFSFLVLLLQLTGASSRNQIRSVTVRAGDDVTLTCENVMDDHSNCNTSTWIHSHTGMSAAVELVELGQITDFRSDRRSVSLNCSLVLRNVSAEDVGRYTCRQFISGEQAGPDAEVYLLVVYLTEHSDLDRTTLTCSVLTQQRCKHRVKWLFNTSNVEQEAENIEETRSSCSAAVTFNPTRYSNRSWLHLFQCEVKTGDEKLQFFPFSPHPSGDDLTAAAKSTPAVAEVVRTTESYITTDWWRLLIVSAGVAALMVVVLVIIIRTAMEGSEKQINENNVRNDEDDDAENYENIRMSEV